LRALVAGVLYLFCASNVFAQTESNIPSLGEMLLQVLGALILISALIVGAAWLAKKLNFINPANQSQLKPLASLTLGRKEKVVIVNACGKTLLLGVASGNVNFLYDLSDDQANGSSKEQGSLNEQNIDVSMLNGISSEEQTSLEEKNSPEEKMKITRSVRFLLFLFCFVSIGTWAQGATDSAQSGIGVAEALLSQSDSGGKGIAALPALTITTNSDGSQDYSVTLQILILMTMLTFLPAMLMMMTSFTRIIIVFAILRQALGLQQSPSNQILIGLSLFLTIFIMSPVLTEIHDDALQPYIAEEITSIQAISIAKEPIREFMLANTRENDIDLFFRIGSVEPVANTSDIPFTVLMPAFLTSELKTAFQIGFIIFIPFLVIDIVVASVLMAMGMMMLSPLIISLPFKIMLFVLVDGWALIVGTLAASFGV